MKNKMEEKKEKKRMEILKANPDARVLFKAGTPLYNAVAKELDKLIASDESPVRLDELINQKKWITLNEILRLFETYIQED